MVSHHKMHQRIYVTNQLIFVVSGISIEKCSFWEACQFKAKSCAIDQVTLGDQPVDAIKLFATPGLFQCISLHFFWLES